MSGLGTWLGIAVAAVVLWYAVDGFGAAVDRWMDRLRDRRDLAEVDRRARADRAMRRWTE